MSALPLDITLVQGQTGDNANPRFVVTSLATRRIFDPPKRAYTQGDTGVATGLGLGLFIVREIAEAHGGRI